MRTGCWNIKHTHINGQKSEKNFDLLRSKQSVHFDVFFWSLFLLKKKRTNSKVCPPISTKITLENIFIEEMSFDHTCVLPPETAQNRISWVESMKTEQRRENENNRMAVIEIIVINHTVNKKKEPNERRDRLYEIEHHQKWSKQATKKAQIPCWFFLLLQTYIIEKDNELTNFQKYICEWNKQPKKKKKQTKLVKDSR